MSPELITFLLGMSPLSELRGAIPIGVFYHNLSLGKAVFLSIFANILVAFLLLIFLNHLLNYIIKKFAFLNRLANWFFEKTRLRHQKKFAKWEDLALVIIVAIPLPFTGAWTGALASYVFGVPFKRAFSLIVLGISIAGFIITLLTINGLYIFK